ncbi:hypothetical protein F511_47301 [Dorcoceras hygrometricum]|uniref:Uncharacterized protein n=1 Tax=Dorcoceras hygrometricum TaxID=472368 RepID=A0A2Z6ZRC4_9LAMI|nr:hypothetical protein F511_47301 [Dorcoceras hygrometricum]
MAAHDARSMSPGLALMVARWSKRSARLCTAIGAAVRRDWRGCAPCIARRCTFVAQLGCATCRAWRGQRDFRQIVATAEFYF